jgi:hypothetical protein
VQSSTSSEPTRAPDSGENELVAGRYRVDHVAGRGGMGTVYRVYDLLADRPVALKRLLVRSRRKNQALALFEREFHTLAELRHPRIIEVYDYGLDAQGAYYTMELLAGADMRELAPLPWPLACKYLREVATTLALLHARKLVHRDLTPANVRIGADGHCKLIDFGALADFGAVAEVIGTPPCVPPEAIEGKPIDQRLDLYALGCLGYFLLTGRHAYPATDSRQLRTFWTRTPEPPSRAPKQERPGPDPAGDRAQSRPEPEPLPDIPQALDTLVMSLLALDPMARPTSASAVIDRLDAIAGRESVPDQDLGESYLASAPLAGRKPELARLKLALDQTQRGRGVTLMISGEPGVGRTRFLAEVALRAKLRGCTVLQVDASEHDGPFGAALALARQLVQRFPAVTAEQTRIRAQDAHGAAQTAALVRLAPELGLRLSLRPPRATPLPPSEEPTRERALCLSALHALIADVARRHPLAVLVDDVHRADEGSLGVLGALAHEARRLKLLVAVTRRSKDEALCESGLMTLAQCGSAIELGLLGERQLFEALSTVFGDAPHLGRLASFLHQRTRGRPSSVSGLVRFLIARGELRHREGAWVLPSEPSDMALPDDVEDAALERLRAEPDAVRALAQALSMHRGALTPELCAAMSREHGEAGSEQQLTALVRCEVLVPGSAGYRFRSERLREKLATSIDPARAVALHLRMGEAILARGAQSPLEQLAAGVHLLEGRDPRGLAIATAAAACFSDRIGGIGDAVRLLERAATLAREANAPAAHLLTLLSPLGLGAYTLDHRLARHSDEIAALLDDVGGLSLGRKLGAFGARFGSLGRRLFTLLGLGIGVLRFYLRPRATRPARYRQVVRWGVGAVVALAGRATICLDKQACDRMAALIEPLRALGMRDPAGVAHEYCATLSIAIEDHYSQTRERWLALDRLLKENDLSEVPIEQFRLWQGGVAYGLGVFESFRGDPAVLERAAELDASGSDMHAMIASQLRLQYHGFRGEAEQVLKAYERMEACAIQAGSSWQVETWSAISINLFASLWHDVITAKRAMRETQRMKNGLPSLERYAISSEATYLLRRGQARECADLYEPLLAAEPPMSRIGWSTSSGLLAEAYNQLGMHREAKALCERVFAEVGTQDRVYFAMRMPVDIAWAVAVAALGEPERAVRYLHELRDCYAVHGSPVALGSVHEALARIELARGNRKLFTENLKQVEAHFTRLANPALIARFQALSDLAGEGGGILTKVAVLREVRAFEAAIEAIEHPGEAARAILAWLMRDCEGDGYLFGPPEQEGEDPVLLAATTEREPGSEQFENVASALRSLGRKDDSTNCGTGAATVTSRDGSSSHLFLLSYLEADEFRAEGALLLLGRGPQAPPIRYELLQVAGQQLRRLGDPGRNLS